MLERLLLLLGGVEILLGGLVTAFPSLLPQWVGFVVIAIGLVTIIAAAYLLRGTFRDRKQTQEAPHSKRRSFTSDQQHQLVEALKLRFPDPGEAHILFFDKQFVRLADELAKAFVSAGWEINHTKTPQSQYIEGIIVEGFNRSVVDVVSDAIRKAGLVDARPEVIGLPLSRDNPKWSRAQKRAIIKIGYEITRDV